MKDGRQSDNRFPFTRDILKKKVESIFKAKGYVSPNEQYWYDAENKNLALRCRKGVDHYTGCDFYLYRKIKLPNETRGRLFKRKIMSVDDARSNGMTPEKLRLLADEMYVAISTGEDPNLVEQRRIEAEQAAAELHDAQGTYREIMEHFISETHPGERYQSDLRKHIDGILKPIEEIKLYQLTQHDLIAIYKEVGEGAQMAQSLREVRAIWNWIENNNQEAFEHKNPVTQMCKTIKWDINHSNAREVIVKKRSLNKFFRSVLDLRNHDHSSQYRNGRDSLLLMAFTGMRVTAAVETPARWVDFDNDMLKLRNKGGKIIEVPMNHATRSLLQNRFRNIPGDRVENFVFPGIGSRRKSHYLTVQGVLVPLRKSSGIDVQNHDLRRTFKSAGAMLGMHEMLLDDLVGHARDKSSVNRHYIQFEDDFLREASDKIVDYLLEEAGFDVMGELLREW